MMEFRDKLEKYGEVTTYKEDDNNLTFCIIGVSHSAVNVMNLMKDISNYCNWPIQKHDFNDEVFYMELHK